jgi:two-component system response regulator YesN
MLDPRRLHVSYKVFLVEDEIVAREGIRDNVDWKSAGFEFSGEAPDGEIALPMIEAVRPDVVITDIKMPFMDGLQLSKIIREHMPRAKIIILSGHDEFQYAQAAVKIGVTEYLLKPVSSQDIQVSLQKLAAQLDQERKELEDLVQLRAQVEDNLALMRERFLLRLVLGGESSVEAIDHSHQLELELIARAYLVLLIQVQAQDFIDRFNFEEYLRLESLIASLASSSPDVFLTRKDLEEWILVVKGDSPEEVLNNARFFANLLRREVEAKSGCPVFIGIGTPQQRLGDLPRSFAEAVEQVKTLASEAMTLQDADKSEKSELLKLDRSVLENYLKSGDAEEFDAFFQAYIRPLDDAVQRSRLVKHYILVEIVLTTIQFMRDLLENPEQLMATIFDSEPLLIATESVDQFTEVIRRIITSALLLRDSQVGHERAMVIQLAKSYLEEHYFDPELSLNEVASQVNLSSSHFSVVFSHETGQTFRDYLANIRIDRAKELLRTTNLKCSEVAYRCGYSDPHYFSSAFKKFTGIPPQKFRLTPQNRNEQGNRK